MSEEKRTESHKHCSCVHDKAEDKPFDGPGALKQLWEYSAKEDERIAKDKNMSEEKKPGGGVDFWNDIMQYFINEMFEMQKKGNLNARSFVALCNTLQIRANEGQSKD